MNSTTIKKYLNDLREEGKYDNEFIDILTVGNEQDEDGEVIATKIMGSINKRYAEDKKNKT
ncbi:MAG TPA: hypothetical protein VMW04_01925 [Patescibacteria group bacterium]|nr:hypothetical protein [Patescibacteria group bacterium]